MKQLTRRLVFAVCIHCDNMKNRKKYRQRMLKFYYKMLWDLFSQRINPTSTNIACTHDILKRITHTSNSEAYYMYIIILKRTCIVLPAYTTTMGLFVF